MKRLAIISGAIVLIFFLIFFLSTSSVDTTPYFDSHYYSNTVARLERLRSDIKIQTRQPIQAGFARVNITPALNHGEDTYEEGRFVKMPLAGFGAREGKAATGIHDSVFVKAVALNVGRDTVVFVTGDLLIMPPNIVDTVTSLLLAKGIVREQVFYSATHTHSSVGGWGVGYVGEMFAGEENINVEKWLALRICEAIVTAIHDLRPARIGTGEFAAATYTRNRLIGESGNKNNDFSFISIEQPGHKKAIIGSYSAHATTLGADNWQVSADYPGYWARKMEETSVDYALFFAGSVGSQSPVGQGDAFAKSKYIGEALADSLNGCLVNVSLKDTVTFSCLSLNMELPAYNLRLTDSRNLATTLTERLLPFSDNVYLQAVRIGDMIWVTTPSDFSGEYALQLKRSLRDYGFMSNVTSFNGSYVGYIVPGRYFYLDEYEPKVMGWFGPNMGEYTMDMIRQITRIITNEDNI